MDIFPLQAKPKTETPEAFIKKVHAQDVYYKSQLLKQQARMCYRRGDHGGSGSPNSRICAIHQSFNASANSQRSMRGGVIPS